jgi:hypothetical protein
MAREDLIDLIGKELYLKAVQSFTSGTTESIDFGHDIPYHFERLKLTRDDEWATWKELVYDLPSYSIWMYVNLFYVNHATETQRMELLPIFVDLIENGNLSQVEATKYSLWVDFFEDPSTVEECWTYLASNIKSGPGWDTLMEISGPVPYNLKKPCYELFLETHSRRLTLRVALGRSCSDAYGDVDVKHALFLVGEIENVDPEVDMADVRALLTAST